MRCNGRKLGALFRVARRADKWGDTKMIKLPVRGEGECDSHCRADG